MNTSTGHNQFQNIPRCVAKFRENRPRGVEKSAVEKDMSKLDGCIVWNAHTMPTRRRSASNIHRSSRPMLRKNR